jgi:hypothetical protein
MVALAAAEDAILRTSPAWLTSWRRKARSSAGRIPCAHELARLSEPPRSVALLSQTDKKMLHRILKSLVDVELP